jgi:thiol-disulfide isomerase/thioredoxin
MAQEPTKEIKPLQVGDKLPENLWNQKFAVIDSTGSTDSLSLEQFRGKLIVLDFWAAWCSNCIQKFTLLAQLQKKYAGYFEVLLVNAQNTKDTPERMVGILSGKKAPFVKSALRSIYNDTTLYQLFPHRYLPHYVWLDAKGQVVAITSAALLSEQTVQQLINVTQTKVQAPSQIKP